MLTIFEIANIATALTTIESLLEKVDSNLEPAIAKRLAEAKTRLEKLLTKIKG